MVEYDRDDPTPPAKRHLGQYWYVFKITFPMNLFWLVVYVLAFTFLVPALSRGQEVEQGNGLVCDTAEQVEKFIELHNQGIKTAEAVGQINEGKVVCVIAPAAFYRGKAVKHVMADGIVYDVVSILVIAMYAGQWIPVAPYEQFTLYRSADKGA